MKKGSVSFMSRINSDVKIQAILVLKFLVLKNRWGEHWSLRNISSTTQWISSYLSIWHWLPKFKSHGKKLDSFLETRSTIQRKSTFQQTVEGVLRCNRKRFQQFPVNCGCYFLFFGLICIKASWIQSFLNFLCKDNSDWPRWVFLAPYWGQLF